jgi:hypothetical protein
VFSEPGADRHRNSAEDDVAAVRVYEGLPDSAQAGKQVRRP